jgi:AraC-like DNA-binding protein
MEDKQVTGSGPTISKVNTKYDGIEKTESDCRDKPRFIQMDVWKRANYYSCTRKAVEYLERSFDKPLGLMKMAEIACMEKTTFSKAFSHKTGMTLHEFIQAYRVSQAALKMERSDYSITEIAFSTGFNSLDTFARAFRKFAEVTPSHYRLEVRRRNGLMANISIKAAS